MSQEWKLVPVEPTDEMIRAGQHQEWTPDVYTAMLAAAPQPPALGGEPGIDRYDLDGFEDGLSKFEDGSWVHYDDHRAHLAPLLAEIERLNDKSNADDQATEGLAKMMDRLEARNAELERVLGGMLFAFDDGVGKNWSAPLLDYARTQCKVVEFDAALNKPAGVQS